MVPKHTQKFWLAYLVAIIGVIGSFILYLVFRNNLPAYLDLLEDTKPYLPWLALFFGLSLSFILAALTRMAQLAGLQALILKQTNENLKKEINDRISAEET